MMSFGGRLHYDNHVEVTQFFIIDHWVTGYINILSCVMQNDIKIIFPFLMEINLNEYYWILDYC